MAHPQEYKTLKGLLSATERTLTKRKDGQHRADGQSIGMWLHNAEYCAQERFNAGAKVRELVAKFAVTRPQDLVAPEGGHALFGVPLPTRDYVIGDNVPGVGLVVDATDTQLYINGNWFHRRCFETVAGGEEKLRQADVLVTSPCDKRSSMSIGYCL